MNPAFDFQITWWAAGFWFQIIIIIIIILIIIIITIISNYFWFSNHLMGSRVDSVNVLPPGWDKVHQEAETKS